MSPFRTRVLAACVFATFIVGAVPSTGAALQVSDDKGGFFWREGTYNAQGRQLDPLDLVWQGGVPTDLMTPANVSAVVAQNWGASAAGGPPPAQHKMTFGQVCLGQRFNSIFGDDGKQTVKFRSEQPSQSGSGFAPDTSRLTDFQGSTSSHCFSQYHMRFWTDADISNNIPGYGPQYQFALSGVHRDIATSSTAFGQIGSGHQISAHWDGYRNYAVHRAMRFLCGRSHWRRRPGSDHNFQGGRFDGWIGTIKDIYDGNNDANCPPGLK